MREWKDYNRQGGQLISERNNNVWIWLNKHCIFIDKLDSNVDQSLIPLGKYPMKGE